MITKKVYFKTFISKAYMINYARKLLQDNRIDYIGSGYDLQLKQYTVTWTYR